MSPELIETLHGLSGGNPGALNVCMAVLTNADSPDVPIIVLHGLQVLKLSGPSIWELFKGECEGDINQFNRAILGKVLESLPL